MLGPYRSLTTQQLETDVGQELQSRGYVAAAAGEQPDLLVNFIVGAHDRVEGMVGGPGWGPGWGRWGPWGPWGGWGGPGYGDIETVTTVSLSIDLINRADNSVVWSGTAYSERTRDMLDHPAQAIDVATPSDLPAVSARAALSVAPGAPPRALILAGAPPERPRRAPTPVA